MKPSDRCDLMFTVAKKRGHGAEIGVGQGVFSERLLELTDPTLLWLVDLWEDDDPRRDIALLRLMRKAMWRMRMHIGTGQVRVLSGPPARGLPLVPRNSLDWLYLDANHTYRGSRDDLVEWSECVMRGGLIAVHSYTSPLKIHGGIREAVDEFAQQHQVRNLQVTDESAGTAWFWKEW